MNNSVSLLAPPLPASPLSPVSLCYQAFLLCSFVPLSESLLSNLFALRLCRSLCYQVFLLCAFVGGIFVQEMLLNGRMRTSSITLTLACVICELAVGVCPCHIHSSTEVVSVSQNVRQPCVLKYNQRWR